MANRQAAQATYMGAMHVTIVRGKGQDYITAERRDGSRVVSTFPHKGPFPHDAVHYVVEQAMGLRQAFWGMVASGIEPAAIAELAKAAGHASASRARQPDPEIVELLQAERLVECFEAEIWQGQGDTATLRQIFRVACESSLVPCLNLADAQIAAIRDQLAALQIEWLGGRLAFDWDEADGR